MSCMNSNISIGKFNIPNRVLIQPTECIYRTKLKTYEGHASS